MSTALSEALVRVRERAGGPGSRAFLAAVGNWLRDVGVEPSSLPLRPLSAFMSSLDGYCRVSGEFVLFDDGGVPEEAIAAISASPGAPAPTSTLRADFWRAMVNDQAGLTFFLDLETLDVIEVAESSAESPIASAPERYVLIPTLHSEEQRAFAVELLKSIAPERAESLILPEPDWMRTFITQAPPELKRALLDARREWVIRRAQEWMRAQGIPEGRFIRHEVPRHNREPQGPPHSNARASRLRESLHRAIDRMTEEELARLLVPARLLVD